MFLGKYLCLYLQLSIWILKTFSVLVKKIRLLHNFYNFYNFYNFIFIFDIQCPFIVCIFEKIADTDTDIYPKTFLETVSENHFCILAGSGCPGSEIILPFSGSNMNFR